MTDTELHPFPPYVPANARLLVMGTFPPKRERWSMDFYYPNRINDFWRIMGLLFYKSPDALLNPDGKTFNLPAIKQMLDTHGIALNDTGAEVRRLRDNASDKYLEIVRPVDLQALLDRMPLCKALCTTGEKAADTLAAITGTTAPRMGCCVNATLADGRNVNIYRMPSTSRAYPLSLAKKAEYYASMFASEGII